MAYFFSIPWFYASEQGGIRATPFDAAPESLLFLRMSQNTHSQDFLPLNTSLDASLERLRQGIAKREAEAESAKVYQFPLWPESTRGVPNELIRSALFAAVDGHNRRQMRLEPISTHGSTVISFTGAQLTQAHLDVFEGIMHLSRGVYEGNRVQFSGHALLKLIGRRTSGREHDWLYGMLVDLASNTVSICKDNDDFFFGALLRAGAGSLKRGNYVVEITRELITLFDRGFTQIQWEQRRNLKQKPLACWLQMYYSSHAKPYPVTVDFLRKQSGSNVAELRKFRQNLKAALEEIKAVGVIKAWCIDADKVTVDRFGTTATPVPSNAG